MIACALILSLLLILPPAANAFIPNQKEMVVVALEVAITLLTASVLFFKSWSNFGQKRAKLLLLASGMISLALAEGACNLDFLRGSIRIRGQTQAELFYIGFWAATLIFIRWHYGPLCTQRWHRFSVLGAFVATSYLQVRFVAPELSAVPAVLSTIPHLSFWIACKSLLAVFAMAYSARVVASCDFFFLHGVLALFCFALSSSYKFAVEGQQQYWVEYGWLAALGGVFLAVAAPQPRNTTQFTQAAQLTPWLSVRSLLAISGFLTGSLVLIGASVYGTLTLQQGLDVPFILWLLLCAWCVSNYIAVGMHKHMYAAVSRVSSLTSHMDAHPTNSLRVSDAGQASFISEFDNLLMHYKSLSSKALALAKDALQADKDAEIGRLAAQVAHDIRSPLAALQTVMEGSGHFDSDANEVATLAIRRVQDIANNLLTQSRCSGDQTPTPQAETCVAKVAEEILSEKRAKFKPRRGLHFRAAIDASIQSATIHCARPDLLRAISNLIDNSAEAVVDEGTIILGVTGNDQMICISVKDDGPGISPDTLSRLGTRGASFGKAHGHGLGLFGARKLAEGASGTFDIKSALGRGTLVSLTFPRCSPRA